MTAELPRVATGWNYTFLAVILVLPESPENALQNSINRIVKTVSRKLEIRKKVAETIAMNLVKEIRVIVHNGREPLELLWI